MTEYKEPRYNVHFRISTMPNGFMVLDYDATPEMGNIYGDEKHGYQMVIRDVSRAEARRVCNVLNEKDDAIIRLEEENKELQEKNKFILGQIRAFRDDCYTAIDFDGASTLNRLLDILGEER